MTDYARDAAAAAAIFGFFGSVWFGWAQESPPRSWRPWLIAGSALSIASLIIGGLLVWRHWNDGTAFDRDTSITFGIVVGVEVALAGLGAAVLGLRGRKELVPVWIALVVGVHFFPVAAIIDYPLIYVVGALVTIGALAAVPVARSRSVAVSAVNGLLVGSVLLAGALVSLALAW